MLLSRAPPVESKPEIKAGRLATHLQGRPSSPVVRSGNREACDQRIVRKAQSRGWLRRTR